MIRTFGEATVGLQKLIAEGIKLCESLEWRKISRLQEKDLNLGDMYTYRTNIISYVNDLEYYSMHYLEMDIKCMAISKTYTTEDYFTHTVATKRERSVKTLKILKKKNVDEDVISLLIDTVNAYIDLCVDVIIINPHLEGIRKRLGVERLLKKYELFHIESDEL